MYNFQNNNRKDIFDNVDSQIYTCPTCGGLDISYDISGLLICLNSKCPSHNLEVSAKNIKKIDLEEFKNNQIEKELEEIQRLEKLGVKIEIKDAETKK